jgi:hypothetical protein
LRSTGLPHAYCFTFDPALIGVHVAADALIGLAYYSIPFGLLFFARQRRDLPFPWIFLLFAVFIIACGTTHWIEIWTLWNPQYWLSGTVKVVTAAASVPTAVALLYLIPRALSLPTATQVVQAKEALEREVLERRRAETELRAARSTLETQVAERTAALERANRKLREEQLFLQTVLDNTPAIIHVKDATGRLLLVNRQFARVAGRPIEEILGRPIDEVLANRHVTPIVEHDRHAMSGNDQVEQEEVLNLRTARTPTSPSRCLPKASAFRAECSAASRWTSPSASAPRRRCGPKTRARTVFSPSCRTSFATRSTRCVPRSRSSGATAWTRRRGVLRRA